MSKVASLTVQVSPAGVARRPGALRAAPRPGGTGRSHLLSFPPAVTFPVGVNPRAVTVADFNNDGKPDLAVVNQGPFSLTSQSSLSVLLGNGNGSFQPAVTTNVLNSGQEDRVICESGAGLRSPDAFTLRRCQILLASAEGLKPSEIAARLGCASQTVRNAIRAFAAEGLACLPRSPTAPGRPAPPSTTPAASGSAPCCTAARATSASRPASGRSTWPPRSPTPRA